ncbi:MAG: hypothetical protein V1755_05735 [Chloroflexota bacterium]
MNDYRVSERDGHVVIWGMPSTTAYWGLLRCYAEVCMDHTSTHPGLLERLGGASLVIGRPEALDRLERERAPEPM